MQKIAALLLTKNSVAFDKEELSFQIQSHPSYPSLHSITGVFDHFNIENVAARVPNTQDVMDQLPNSFIAQINGQKGLDVVLVEKSNTSYKIYDQEGKKQTLNRQEFLDQFTGIILAVEKDDEQTIRKGSPKNLITNIGFALAATVLASLLITSTNLIPLYVVFAISIIGILISVSILKQEFGVKNTIGDAFCSSDSEKKDCNAVLTSNGATIIKGYKLSDLSLIYFVGLSLTVFLLSLQDLSLNLIYWIGILSLPITIYSIFYQAFIVKSWCLLCLSIAGILWIQTAIPFVLDSFSFELVLSVPEILTLLIGFLGSFSIWSYTKPKITKASEDAQYKLDYYKFIRKYSLFSTLLNSKPQLNTALDNKDEIVFGNKNSNLEIVIATNPFCGHCKPVHTIVEDILKQYHDHVKIVIRFYITLNDKEADVVKITTNLMHIYHEKGQEICLQAMEDAYNKLKPKEWSDKWTQPQLEFDRFFNTLETQREWCTKNQINFTPEILVNGRSFPKEYKRSDILFFIEDLYEEHNQKVHNEELVPSE